jgi:hypothetical protein
VRDFELSPAALPAAPKWGRACSWTPRDDAMLLLGVYRYGIDHWDRCVRWAAMMLFPQRRTGLVFITSVKATSQSRIINVFAPPGGFESW